jgi:NAD+ diphosphatase
MPGFNLYSRYQPGYQLIPDVPADGRWFLFHGHRLLVRRTTDGPDIPDHSVLEHFRPLPDSPHYLGKFAGAPCYCLALSDAAAADIPPDHALIHLRALGRDLPGDVFTLAGRAAQILHWDQQTRFCGRCGAPTHLKADERAKVCDVCGSITFPRISPAIIIAIFRGDQILLAHNRHFEPGMHSLIAGFMEPGETFEETARREVHEEVGLAIRNIRYFASQPWPFPDSLMIGLLGEYESGDIRPDGQEIESAGWFCREQLPAIPDATSIAGRIIRWYQAHPEPLAAFDAQRPVGFTQVGPDFLNLPRQAPQSHQ